MGAVGSIIGGAVGIAGSISSSNQARKAAQQQREALDFQKQVYEEQKQTRLEEIANQEEYMRKQYDLDAVARQERSQQKSYENINSKLIAQVNETLARYQSGFQAVDEQRAAFRLGADADVADEMAAQRGLQQQQGAESQAMQIFNDLYQQELSAQQQDEEREDARSRAEGAFIGANLGALTDSDRAILERDLLQQQTQQMARKQTAGDLEGSAAFNLASTADIGLLNERYANLKNQGVRDYASFLDQKSKIEEIMREQQINTQSTLTDAGFLTAESARRTQDIIDEQQSQLNREFAQQSYQTQRQSVNVSTNAQIGALDAQRAAVQGPSFFSTLGGVTQGAMGIAQGIQSLTAPSTGTNSGGFLSNMFG